MFVFNFRCTSSSGAPRNGECERNANFNAGDYMKMPKVGALLFGTLVLITLVLLGATAQKAHSTTPPSQSSPVPEMKRLAKALVGDWNTTETMERGESFPNGGSRHGLAHVKLAAGETTLIYEVHSDGSAGKLDGMLVIWWDKEASLYRVFVCFNNPGHPCEMRGTARWEGDSFVNDYEQTVKGKKTSWRDSFTFRFTPPRVAVAELRPPLLWMTTCTRRCSFYPSLCVHV